MDTVEWGTGDRPARRFPALRFAVPRVGGLALAVAGFGLLVAAEIVPWASVQSASANTAQTAVLGGNQLEVGLDRITAGSGFTYHLGVIVLLGAVGLVLASPPARRRILAGLALGVAAAQVLMVVAVTRTAMRTFDTLTVLNPSRSGTGFQTNLGLQADSGYRVVLGEGVYLASAAIQHRDLRPTQANRAAPCGHHAVDHPRAGRTHLRTTWRRSQKDHDQKRKLSRHLEGTLLL